VPCQDGEVGLSNTESYSVECAILGVSRGGVHLEVGGDRPHVSDARHCAEMIQTLGNATL